jgi:hypothetical protein
MEHRSWNSIQYNKTAFNENLQRQKAKKAWKSFLCGFYRDVPFTLELFFQQLADRALWSGCSYSYQHLGLEIYTAILANPIAPSPSTVLF